MNKISRLDVEVGRANGAIVGNFRLGFEDARVNGYAFRMSIALLGLLLTLPAALRLAAGFLKQFFGVAPFYDSMQTWNQTLMWTSLFIGAPLALLAGVITVTRVGLSRAQDRINAFLSVRVNPIVLFTIAISLAVVAIFWGHLLVDGWACMRGIASAC